MATLTYGTREFHVHGRPRVFDGVTEARIECQVLIRKIDYYKLQEATLEYDVHPILLEFDEGVSTNTFNFSTEEFTRHSRFEHQKIGSEFDIGGGGGLGLISSQVSITIQKAAPEVDDVYRRDGIINLMRESNELPSIMVSAEYTAAGVGTPSGLNAYEYAESDIESYAIGILATLLPDEDTSQWKLVRRNVEQIQYNFQKAFGTVEFRKQLIADAAGGIYTPQFTGVSSVLTSLTVNPARAKYFSLESTPSLPNFSDLTAATGGASFAVPDVDLPEIETEEPSSLQVYSYFQSEIRYNVLLQVGIYDNSNIKNTYETIVRPRIVDDAKTTLGASILYVVQDSWEFDEILNKFSVVLTAQYVTSANPVISYKTSYRYTMQRVTDRDMTENKLVVSSTGYIQSLTMNYRIERIGMDPLPPPRLDGEQYYLDQEAIEITQDLEQAGSDSNQKTIHSLTVSRTYLILG